MTPVQKERTTGSGRNEIDFISNADGSVLCDHKGNPVTVERYLSTKPLRSEVSTRKGPGGKKLSYMGGDIVTKTLNETFGYDGWSLEVKNTTHEEPIKDEQGRYHVSYIATARITHTRSGAYREDCGAGDAIDKSLATASGNALKGAVTDAMKRAARHFGEKLGNSLYHDGFNANNAPPTLKEALDMLDIDRANSRFGFEKNGEKTKQNIGNASTSAQSSTLDVNLAPPEYPVTASSAKSSTALVEQKPRIQYVGNVVMEHLNNASKQSDVKSLLHAPPHHGVCTTQNLNYASATNRITPCNRIASVSTNNMSSSVDLSTFDLSRTTANLDPNSGKENTNPLSLTVETGSSMPTRPGTSRGVPESPTSAYNANYSDSIGTLPSMFGAHGSMSQALVIEQSQSTTIAQSLKRKSEAVVQATSAGPDAKWAKNPYHC